jgi:hypothetical protein
LRACGGLILRWQRDAIAGAAFRAASTVLVKAKDAKGMLALIEERTDMHYEDFGQLGAVGAKGATRPASATFTLGVKT